MKRKCKCCSAVFNVPLISKDRHSKRTTCSYACRNKLIALNRAPWSEEEDQFIHDYANNFPLRLFYSMFKSHCTKNNWPTRTFFAFEQRVLRLGYSKKSLHSMITPSRLAGLLGISSNCIDDWPRQGLRISYVGKNRARYFTIDEVKRFAKERPQNFGGIPYQNLFVVFGDEELCSYIRANYPKRNTCLKPRRRVLCVTTNKIYNSLTAASKDTFLHKASIYKSCRFNRETCGLQFQYLD